MKKQTKSNWQTTAFAIIAIVFVFGASNGVLAQKGVGAKYGARDPQTCADTKAPAKGAITAALAAKYFICGVEKEDYRYLQLVENVKVEVGGGIPYAAIIGHRSFPEVDVKHPVYPIRGSHTQYLCNAESDYYQPGKNCTRYEHRNAKGYCYKTTFGDWRCHQSEDSIPNDRTFSNVPPPKGDKNAAANKTEVNEKTAETKNANQTVETTNKNQPDKTEDKTTTEKDENGLVKPDFSELEKDFEIVKYEFDTSTRPPAIYIIAKVKKPNGGTNALSFEGRFYDADGVNIMLPAERVWAVSGDTSKAGEVVKIRVWTPSEQQMQNKVKKITIARKVD
ncbi:MAG TPA: hypothetical protein PKY82_16940 [Pyrinomonadaceae bacterium]|nr:hypothetical protein [Pyrinomonadaceae bacterium]